MAIAAIYLDLGLVGRNQEGGLKIAINLQISAMLNTL